MARAKFVSDYERDIIRVGHARGISNTDIGKYLGRTGACVGQQIKKMREAGTLGDLPFAFMVDEAAAAIKTGQK